MSKFFRNILVLSVLLVSILSVCNLPSNAPQTDDLLKIDPLIKKILLQEDGVAKFLTSKLREAANGYDKGEAWLNGFDAENQQPGITGRETFVVLLNVAIQSGVLYDEKAFSGRKIPDNLMKAAAKPPTGEKLWKLNREILVALFPEEVNPDAPGN